MVPEEELENIKRSGKSHMIHKPDIDRIPSRYRIVNNGITSDNIRYKVQRRYLFWWRDCPLAGKYASELMGWGAGIYETEGDAVNAINDLIRLEVKSKLKKF